MKTKINNSKKTTKTKTTKTVQLFQGKVEGITRVLSRPMKEFKNCKATCWLLIGADRYVFGNSYNGDIPKASFAPKDYEYKLTEKAQKLLDKKIEEQQFVEIEDPSAWPEWISSARRRATRKSK